MQVTRVHSFIQIFTKHLLSAKYHTRHRGKYREEADRMPALGRGKINTNKHDMGSEGQGREANRYREGCGRVQAGGRALN